MTAAEAVVRMLEGAPGQAHRLLRLHTALGRDMLVPERMDGWESVDGGGFRFVLTALSTRADLPLARLLGSPLLLQLQQPDDGSGLRPFHGHVMSVERLGSNGGLARYRLVVEPWLSFLRLRRDSYAFRDATVIEIVEEVFSFYSEGAVVPAWRWDLRDRDTCPRRSLCTQYEESDLAFVTRLLAEEGIFYWFEHAGDTAARSLGGHTLVLADHGDAFRHTDPRLLRFHRAASPEQADTAQRGIPVRRWRAGAVSRASWDYRTRSTRAVLADASGRNVPAADEDVETPYAWINRAQGQRRARRQLDASRSDADVFVGTSNFRGLSPGSIFRLRGHPTHGDEPLACLRVRHGARNNLSAEIHSALEEALGATLDGSPPGASDVAVGGQANEYTNRFVSMPASRAYRPIAADRRAPVRWAAAPVSGAHSAIVAGQEHEPVHTDRDHRVIVQQHWQRGENAASRLDHPRASNAPADRYSGTWARVVTSMAGANWGTNSLPRVGQEVWVDHLEGDADRPVVIAGLYNGRGREDAPHNAVSGGASKATGNAAAWFAGNGHPGVLSGFRTQDLGASRSGTGGWRELQFDDTPGQGHVRLATSDYDTRLALGHLKHMEGNRRQVDLGYGAELATQAQGALRGGAGLLVAAAPGDSQMDASASRSALMATADIAKDLAQIARKQQAQLAGEAGSDPPEAVARQQALAEEMVASERGRGDHATGSEWGKPHFVVHGQDGVVMVTPEDHVLASGTDAVLAAGRDAGIVAQGRLTLLAGRGVALYAQGDVPPVDRAVQATGVALAAAEGDVRVRARSGAAELVAEKAVALNGAEADVRVSARRRVLLAAGGAYLRLEGGNIEIGAPGDVEFKGVLKELGGPQGA